MKKRNLLDQARSAPPADVKVGLEVKSSQSDEQRELVSVSHSVKTVEDALRKAEVDTTLWEVERFLINSWECVGDKIGRQPLWQVKVWLRRKSPKQFTDAIEALCGRIKKHAPKYPKIKLKRVSDPHLLEICIFDAHFGKLAWAAETGSNYDLQIAERVFQNAVHDLVASAAGSFDGIEKILLPVGNDFLHIDNLESATTQGTRVDSDGRYAKIIESATVALHNAIDLCAGHAPVDIIWVPGNHDRIASYHVCRELKAHYTNAKHVTVDVSPTVRKYYEYGVTLLGFTHGNEEPHAQLPQIMATEMPERWARTTHHEWHVGHTHAKKKREWLSVNENNGAVVRTLPSLSGTDAWHYLKGYVGSKRSAECYLWSKARGYSGHFSAGVRE